MKISTKLYGVTGALLGLGAVIAGLSTSNLSDLGQQLDAANRGTAIRIDKVDSIRAQAKLPQETVIF